MQKIRVIDIAYLAPCDIDPDRRIDVKSLDGLVNRCSSAATSALKKPPTGYSEIQAINISWIFDSMRFTHVTIRNLIAEGTKTPACVDALALTRLQLETLYSVCLIVQDSGSAADYVKNFWVVTRFVKPCHYQLLERQLCSFSVSKKRVPKSATFR